MKKSFVVILSLLSFFPILVFAKECDDFQISNKRTLANNINWAYEYYLKNNKMYFNLIVTNVFEDLYIKNIKDGKKYSQKEFTIQNLSDDQKLTFEVYSKNCNVLVSTKEVYLPKYNTFYGSEYCNGISEFSYCGKWSALGDSISIDTLIKETTNYRENMNSSTVKTTNYETNITGFYIFISLILVSLALFLFFLRVGKIRKDFI